MQTQVGIASGLLSLKQFPHGTVVIGGGWQGRGDRVANTSETVSDSVIGNVRLRVMPYRRLKVSAPGQIMDRL